MITLVLCNVFQMIHRSITYLLNILDIGLQLQVMHLSNGLEACRGSPVTSSIMKKPKIELKCIEWFYIIGTVLRTLNTLSPLILTKNPMLWVILLPLY